MVMKKGVAVVFTILLFCASCGDADLFDTDKWSNKVEGWEPGVSLQLVHGSFTIWDLINQGQDSVIVKEGNDLIIRYTKEDVYSVKIEDVFELKGEPISFDKRLEWPGGMVPPVGWELPDAISVVDTVVESIPLPDDFAGTKLTRIKLEKGSCSYRLPDIGTGTSVAVYYWSEGDWQMLVKSESDRVDGQLSLKGLVFDLIEDKDSEKENCIQLKYVVELEKGAKYNGNPLELSIYFSDYDFDRIEGKVVKADGIQIDRDYFDMNVDFLNEIGGNFKFTNPQLELVVRNKGLGVPVKVDMTFEGESKEGIKGTLTLNDGLMFQGNSSIAEVKEEIGRVDKDNSNIVDFLSLPPQGNIYYQGQVFLNPEQKDNVIYKEGSLDMDVNVRIPFSLSATALTYRDTLKDIEIEQKYANKVKEGVIAITAKNGLPLKLEIPKLILMDDNGNEIDAITAQTGKSELEAGSNDNPVKSVLEFSLTQEQARKLGQTTKILLEAKASTPGGSGVTIPADATLSFELRIVAKAIIDDLDDF